MGENYKIELGIGLKTDDLADIRKKINSLEDNPIKIKVDAETKELTKTIRDALNGLSKGSVTLDTSKIETSLDKLSSSIIDIKTSLGTLDGKGMKDLVSSVNQMVTALSKAENESEGLVASLNALSKKDFSINIGLDLGKKNNNNMIAYGRTARKQVIPELEAQIKELENLFGGEQAAMNRLTSQGKKVDFDVFTDFADFNSDSAIKKMEAMEKYINSLKKLAALDDIKLDGFNEIHKDATELINDITGVENAVDKAGDVPEKLKNLFGGSIDGENLSKQLDDIVVNLGEIKTVVQGLSSGVSIEGWMQSFDRLSDTIEKLVSNVTIVQSTLNSGFSGAGNNISNVTQQFREVDIKIGSTEDQVQNLKIALKDVGFNSGSIDTITKDFEKLGVSVKKVTSHLNDDGSVVLTVRGIDQFERAVTVMKSVDTDGAVANLGTSISQSFKETEESYRRLTSLAGKMSKMKVDIAKLNPETQPEKYAELTAQYSKLKNEYNDLYNVTKKNLNSGQVDALHQKFRDAEVSIRILKAGMADTSAEKQKQAELKKTTESFEKLKSVAKEIGSLKIKIAGLDTDKNADEIAELTRQLTTLQSEYDELYLATSKNLNDSQIEELGQASIDTTNKINVLNAKMADTSATKQATSSYKEMLDVQKKISSLSVKIKKLDASANVNEVNELSSQLKLLKSDYEALKRTFGSQLSTAQWGNLQAEIDQNIQQIQQNVLYP